MSFGDDVKLLEKMLLRVEEKRLKEAEKVFHCPMCNQPVGKKDVNWKVCHP